MAIATVDLFGTSEEKHVEKMCRMHHRPHEATRLAGAGDASEIANVRSHTRRGAWWYACTAARTSYTLDETGRTRRSFGRYTRVPSGSLSTY